MSAVLQFVMHHGYLLLFAAVFAHQVGLPLPAPPILLAAGALAATGKLRLFPVLALTVIACVLADWIWYEAGRRRGDKVLHFIHCFTRDPDAHDRRAKETFARYGPPILLLAKFVPGLDAIAPPLTGISRTSRFRFLAFDAGGATLYACAYTGLGYVFSRDLDRVAAYASRAGTVLAGLAFVGLFIYVAYRMIRRHRTTPESLQPCGPDQSHSMEYRASVTAPCRIVEGLDHGD